MMINKNTLFILLRSCSSVGRAPPRQGGGRWFETSRDHHAENLY